MGNTNTVCQLSVLKSNNGNRNAKELVFSFQPDVNECLIDAPNCTHGTSCINTLGGYQCVCIGGRYGANCQYGEYSSCRDK